MEKIKFVKDQRCGIEKLYNDTDIENFNEKREIVVNYLIIKIKGSSVHPASITKLKLKYPHLKLQEKIKYEIPDIAIETKKIFIPANANIFSYQHMKC